MGRSLSEQNLYGAKRAFDTSRIYFAQVMDTRDPLHAGRLKVWIISSQTDKNDKTNWVIARHSSNWYGTSMLRATGKVGSESPISYGETNGIPYTGSLVAIFFPPVVGENTNPYWFSCPVDDVMNVMAAGEPGNPPMMEENVISHETEENTPLINAIETQGLEDDKLRGYGSNTPDRGDFPTSYAYTSPLGNTITLDDGWSTSDPKGNWDTEPDKNELMVNGVPHEKVNWIGNIEAKGYDVRYNAGIRLRTRNGTQLLISDNGNIYAINSDGSAWLELSNDGHIDCWAKQGINMATDGDINFNSKGNVNFEVGGDFNLSTTTIKESATKVEVSASSSDFSGEIRCQSLSTSNIVCGEIYSMNAQLTGTFSGTLNGTAYMSNICCFTGTPLPMPATQTVKAPVVTEPQAQLVPGTVLKEPIDGLSYTQNYSINTRLPTHEPWQGHNLNDKFPK